MSSVTATFLFTDIVGSTELRSRLGDDAADEIHGRIEEATVANVWSAGGEVVKGLGDGVMAMFSSAADALASAVSIQEEVDGVGEVRIGVNSGEVSHRDGDYSGLPVVIASRLCDLASGGEILTTGVVRSLVGSRGGFGYSPLGRRSLKGITEPVEVWRVVAFEESSEGVTVSAALFPSVLSRLAGTDLVGRHHQLAELDVALEEVATGEQRVLTLAGEPGIGKSALAAVFARKAADAGAAVLAGRCPAEAVASYQPFIEVLRQVIAARPRLVEQVPGARELARLVPDLAPTLSLPTEVKGDPGTQRYVLFEAFASMLYRLAEERQVMVVLDDLHWADESSLALFRHLCTHPQPAPLLILVTYRDTDLVRTHPLARILADLRRERRVQRVELKGLGAENVADMVAVRAGTPASERTVAEIFAETEGNPFFIEEVVSYLIETGVVDPSGEWQSDATIEEVGIPEGVRDVIGRRLQQLDEDANRTLTTAAVIGREFDISLLAGDDDWEEVEDHLGHAVESGLVEESDDQSGRYSFSHALIRQTLYEELTATRRARLHSRVAERLESQDAPPGELAHHWAAAHDIPNALAMSVQAARAAGDVFAFDEERRHLELVLELWAEVDDPEEISGIDLAGVYHRLAETSHRLEGAARPVELIEQAIALVDSVADPIRAGFLEARRATFLWWEGRGEEARVSAEKAVRLIPTSPASPERAKALSALARLLQLAGQVDEAEVAAEEAIAVATESGDRGVVGQAHNTLGLVHADRGDIEGGIAMMERAKQLAEEENLLDDILRASNNLSVLLWRAGRVRDYRDEGAAGFELASRFGVRAMGAFLVGHVAFGHLHLGEWEEAARVVDRDPLGDAVAESNLDNVRVGLATRTGDFEAAKGPLEAQLEHARGNPDPQSIAIPYSLGAEYAYWEKRYQDALQLIIDALKATEGSQERWFISWLPTTGLDALRRLLEAEPEREEEWLEVGQRLASVAEECATTGVAHPVANGSFAAALWAGIQRAPDPDLWDQAVERWEALSMPYGVAWVRTAYAEDLLTMGRSDEANVQLDLAEESAQRLGAQPLLERIGAARERTLRL